jgi:hypothetical protein
MLRRPAAAKLSEQRTNPVGRHVALNDVENLAD